MASNDVRSESRWFGPGSSAHSWSGRALAVYSVTSRAQSSGRWISKTRASVRTGRCRAAHRPPVELHASRQLAVHLRGWAGHGPEATPAELPGPVHGFERLEAGRDVEARRLGGAVPPLLRGDVDGLVQCRSERLLDRLGDRKPFLDMPVGRGRRGRRLRRDPRSHLHVRGIHRQFDERPERPGPDRAVNDRAARRRDRCRGERRAEGRRRTLPSTRASTTAPSGAAPAPRRGRGDPTPSQRTSGAGQVRDEFAGAVRSDRRHCRLEVKRDLSGGTMAFVPTCSSAVTAARRSPATRRCSAAIPRC